MRRMDRYNEEENTNKLSRADKNKDLYKNIGNNTRYTNFTDVANANAFEIGSLDRSKRTRENYQKMREYSNLIPGHGGVLDRFDSVIYVSLVLSLINSLM